MEHARSSWSTRSPPCDCHGHDLDNEHRRRAEPRATAARRPGRERQRRKAFFYTWFTLFEHRAPAERLAEHLTTSEPLSLAFPGAEPLSEVKQFTDWYEQLIANTEWNFHELSNITVEFVGNTTYDIAFDVDWQGGVTEASAWPTNLPERRFRFDLRQQWRVTVHAGRALDNPFSIARLVAGPR